MCIKYYYLSLLLIFSLSCFSQVGINTTNPQASLDVSILNPASPSSTDGILIPRVDEFPTTNPSAAQDGMIVFVTGIGSVDKGLYYWDNSIPDWVSFLTTSVERINDLFDGKSEASGSSLFLGINAGQNDNGGNNRNLGIGFQALQANENSINNVAIGWNSLNALLTGSGNTAIGVNALTESEGALRNVAIGRDAMRHAGDDVSNNVAVGANALHDAEIDNAVAIGYQALRNITTGVRNIGVGMESIFRNTTGDNNTVMGHRAMRQNLTGSSNVAIGNNSFREASEGDRNISIGHYAMRNVGSGNDNIVIGTNAMSNAVSGNEIVAIGNGVLQNSNDSSNKLAIGHMALASNQTSVNNTAIGYRALNALQSGTGENTAIGERALENTTSGRQNVAIGLMAMGNTGAEPFRNVAIGYHAMRDARGGAGVAIGVESMRSTTTGRENAALGNRSMFNNTTGSNNAAFGYQVMINNTTANRNTAMGYRALGTNTTGSHNTVIGNTALGGNDGGNDNVAIGSDVGRNVTGSRNVLIGREAGRGFEDDATAFDGCVFIGYQAGYFETNSNRLYIHNSDADDEGSLIYGEFDNNLLRLNAAVGIDRNPTTNALEVNGEASKTTAGAFVANSDKRLKKNIQTVEGKTALELISKMNGVTYEWNDNITGNKRPQGVQYGFIAQELKILFPEKVTKDALGYFQTAYGDYDALYVQAIKELKDQNEKLLKEIERLKDFEERISNLENLILHKDFSKTNN